MKFLSTFLRTIGIVFIVFLSVVSIFFKGVSNTYFDNAYVIAFLNYFESFEDGFYDFRIAKRMELQHICDVDGAINLILRKKAVNAEKFNEAHPFGINNFLENCDNVQIERLLSSEIFEDENYKGLKKEFNDYLSKMDSSKKLTRVSDYKLTTEKENLRYVSDQIVLLKVDDESLAKINSWPIPRENWTTIINNLGHYNAKVISFDVLFPEEVKSCGEISPDDQFAQAISQFQADGEKKVILPFTVQTQDIKNLDYFEETPSELYFLSAINNKYEDEESLLKDRVETHTWPIQKLLDAEPELGYLNMQEDPDGVFRNYQAVSDVGDVVVPSLGLRSYISYTGKSPNLFVDRTSSYLMLETPKNKDEKVIKLDTSIQGRTKIKWLGKENNYDSISLYKVLYGDKDDPELKEFFNNKIVFIGSTAIGAHDLRNTAIDAKLPGVYAHMNFTDMLLQKNFFAKRDQNVPKSFIFLGVCMIILVITMLFGSAILDIVILSGIVVGTYYIDYYYFINKGYQINLFYIYFSVIATYSYITFLNFNKASAEKKQIKGAFSRYVAPSIVNDMLDNPDKLKVGGEKRDITCMFSDVRDFTSISEKLTPTELAQALNRYMGAMTDIVFDTAGTLDKYIGDAIVAFWGAPLDIGDHVNAAMDASVKMMEALPEINEEFKSKGLPEFKIGLGLNSGECSVGNMGSDQIFAYTALGDNMNLGARLESLCKHYGAQILISEYTFERMDQNKFQSRLIDKVKVKGKTEPVGVYEVLYSYHPFMKDQDSLKLFKQAFNLFLEGQFAPAKEQFEQILETHHHDKASLRMRETCIKWIETPPKEGEDWTITTMTTKG